MDIEITHEEVITVKAVKQDIKDRLEMTPDDNGVWKFCYFSDHLFDTEDEAMDYILNNDELYTSIKHLKDEDKVIESYGGECEELLPYVPYKEN